MGQSIVYGRPILRRSFRSFLLQRLNSFGQRDDLIFVFIELVTQRVGLSFGCLGRFGLLNKLFGQFARGRAGYSFGFGCFLIRFFGLLEKAKKPAESPENDSNNG
jgi:hypothetical protein